MWAFPPIMLPMWRRIPHTFHTNYIYRRCDDEYQAEKASQLLMQAGSIVWHVMNLCHTFCHNVLLWQELSPSYSVHWFCMLQYVHLVHYASFYLLFQCDNVPTNWQQSRHIPWHTVVCGLQRNKQYTSTAYAMIAMLLRLTLCQQ